MKRERRKFTNEFKAEVALEAIKEKLTMVELAMKYKVNPVQIKAWKKEFLDNKASVFGSEGSSKTKREKEQLNKQEQELFEQIGRLKMENEWLKKSSMMTLDLRKSLVNKQDKYFTVEHQCQLLSIPKSTFYYQPIGIQEEDLKIMSIMDRLYLEDPTMGTRRYAAEVTKRGYHLGRQHAKTLMQLMGIAAIYPKPRTTVIDKAKYKYPYLLRGISINAPNVAWGIDISYIPMRYGFMYLTAIIDIYSKYIVGWSISNTMDATWVVDTLKQAVKQHGAPKYINSDQGSQFTSDEYTEYVKSLKETEISMDGKGRATDNAHIERFFRTIKYDKLYLAPSTDGTHLYQQCSEFIEYYNQRRGHSSHKYETPNNVYQQVA